MTDRIEFFVPGEPVEKGSTRAFYIRKLDRVVTTNANTKTKGWQSRIAMKCEEIVCQRAFREEGYIGYKLDMTFYKSRAKSLSKWKHLAITRPDLDKYIRTILDAVAGIAFADDNAVTDISARKRHCDENYLADHRGMPGVYVIIEKVREKREKV